MRAAEFASAAGAATSRIVPKIKTKLDFMMLSPKMESAASVERRPLATCGIYAC